MSLLKAMARHFIDFISIIFMISFFYSLIIFWIRLPEPETKFDNFVFEIVFWILGAWMMGISFRGIGKMINRFFLKFS